MFSKACEYGIKAAIHISLQSQKGERVCLNAIAKAINSPVAFTAKILQSLANSNVIVSTKGSNGGYEIAVSELGEITLFNIVEAIDGNKFYRGCGLGLKQCNENKPCPIHFQFKAIREDLTTMLKETSINELANDLNKGLTFLKR